MPGAPSRVSLADTTLVGGVEAAPGGAVALSLAATLVCLTQPDRATITGLVINGALLGQVVVRIAGRERWHADAATCVRGLV